MRSGIECKRVIAVREKDQLASFAKAITRDARHHCRELYHARDPRGGRQGLHPEPDRTSRVLNPSIMRSRRTSASISAAVGSCDFLCPIAFSSPLGHLPDDRTSLHAFAAGN